MPFDSNTDEQQASNVYRGEWLGPVGGFLLVIVLGVALWSVSIWLVFRLLG
jgi:hypothetical protein